MLLTHHTHFQRASRCCRHNFPLCLWEESKASDPKKSLSDGSHMTGHGKHMMYIHIPCSISHINALVQSYSSWKLWWFLFPNTCQYSKHWMLLLYTRTKFSQYDRNKVEDLNIILALPTAHLLVVIHKNYYYIKQKFRVEKERSVKLHWIFIMKKSSLSDIPV